MQKRKPIMIKQRYAVIVLFALIVASCMTGFFSFSSKSLQVDRDMDRALTLTLLEQRNDVITQDTIRTFNGHLQMAELRGKATLVVSTQGRRFRPYAHCDKATIFSLSDQRPAAILWALTMVWGAFCLYRRRHDVVQSAGMLQYGGLRFAESDARFYDSEGRHIRFTPMQHQLMQMFLHSPSHTLAKTEICEALWPKKPDASETLYTLIRRLKPVVEQHTDLRIESDRSRSYRLTIK